MKIKKGERIPSTDFFYIDAGGAVKKIKSTEFLAKQKAIVIGVPGAFTKVCSVKHLPGYVNNFEDAKKKGVTKIKYPKFMMIPGDNDLSSQAMSSALKHVNSVDLLMLFPVNFDNRSKIRNIVSHIYRIIYLIFFDTYVHYINGPSIFPTENVKNLKLYSSRFSIISEMITKLLHSEITYCEIPFFFEAKSRK